MHPAEAQPIIPPLLCFSSSLWSRPPANWDEQDEQHDDEETLSVQLSQRTKLLHTGGSDLGFLKD